MAAATLAIRIDGKNPSHHLWNNHGTWWCHFTVHRADFTKARVRCSLRTGDPAMARHRRDRLLANRALCLHPPLRNGAGTKPEGGQ